MLEFNLFDPRIQQIVNEVVDADVGATMYRPEVHLLKPGTDIDITARFGSLSILQDFESNYQDVIQLIVELRPEEYRSVLTNLQDLECQIILYPVDNRTITDIYDKDPIILEYVVFIENQEDVDKQMQSNVFGDNAEDGDILSQSQAGVYIPFKTYLMSKSMRDIRKVQLNMIATDVDMDAILHWACQQFGVKKCIIIKPDNTSKFNNFIIPPMKNISNLLPYLQDRYGIYKKGMGYYYTDDTLFIYPLYDIDSSTSPTKDNTIRIVNAVKTVYEAIANTHNWVDGELNIIAAKYAHVSPVNTASSENKGDTLVSFNADGILDYLAPVQGSGKVEINDNLTVIRRQNTATNMTSNNQSVVYKNITSNIYQSTSLLAADDGSYLRVLWPNSEPFSISPGQQLEYLYSTNDGNFTSMKGRVLGAEYVSVRCGINPNEPYIVFNSLIVGFMEAEKKSADSYLYN